MDITPPMSSAVASRRLDEMSERARDNYLFARTVVGRDYDVQVVVATTDRP